MMRKIANGDAGDEAEEYCILNIETRHQDCINSVQYLQECIATGSKDGVVKVYNLDMKFIKKDKK
jgi:hypothetical protein